MLFNPRRDGRFRALAAAAGRAADSVAAPLLRIPGDAPWRRRGVLPSAGNRGGPMKKRILVVLLLLLATGYIACGGSSNSMPTQPVVSTPTAGVPPPMTPTPPY